MPLPAPKPGEGKEQFVNRCMGDSTMGKEYPKADQRYAICQAQWKGKASDSAAASMVPVDLILRGDADSVKIEAAAQGEDKPALRRFSMNAYTGGAMTLSGWPYPVVVDLSGLALGKKARPILMDHDSGRIVGHTDVVSSEGGVLSVAGVVSGVGSAAQEVVGASDNGFPWQASIGAAARKVVFVPEGKSAVANGKNFDGPVYVVRQSRLGEVSFVALGADDNTSARVEAGTNISGNQMEVMTMEFEEWVKAKGFVLANLSDEQVATLKASFEAQAADRKPESGSQKGDAQTITASVSVLPPVPVSIQATAKPKGEASSAGNTADRGADSREQADSNPIKGDISARIASGKGNAGDAPLPSIPAPTIDIKAEAEKAIRAERDRVTEIQAICAGEFSKIEREAIQSGWDADRTRAKVLAAIRQNRPQAEVGFSIMPERSHVDATKRLEAALCFRAGIDEKTLVAFYGEQVATEAYHDRDIALQQLFVECARAEGVILPRHFCNDTIRAAFSTISLPGILNNVANKKLLKSFQAQPIIATQLCSEGELNDFKESERYRLTDVGDLEPVAPDGEIKHGGLSEEKATNQLRTYGKSFSLTRQMVFNDDLSAFLRVPEGMGARAARKVDQLFFQRLLANPGSLFSAAHKNYKEGADSVLTGDSLAVAIQMFLDQVDVDGQPINIAPRYLLVPTALKMTARELLNSTILLSVGSTNKQRIPTYNPLADENLEVVTSPYLSNGNYSGSSAKAWYLFADPQVCDTFEIGYLRGRRTPSVEQGDADFDTLGIKFRVFYDLGVREQDHRGMCKFKGE